MRVTKYDCVPADGEFVTPEMIEAGVVALSCVYDNPSPSELAERVYLSMVCAAPMVLVNPRIVDDEEWP